MCVSFYFICFTTITNNVFNFFKSYVLNRCSRLCWKKPTRPTIMLTKQLHIEYQASFTCSPLCGHGQHFDRTAYLSIITVIYNCAIVWRRLIQLSFKMCLIPSLHQYELFDRSITCN